MNLLKGFSWFRRFGSSGSWPVFRRVGWGLLFFLVTAFIVGSGYFSRGYSLKEGQISPVNIYAPRTIVYVDEIETERLRREAAARVEKSYREDTRVPVLVEEKIEKFFATVKELRDADLPPEERLSRLRTYFVQDIGVPSSELEVTPASSLLSLLQGSDEELAEAEAFCKSAVQEELSYGLMDDALPNARENPAERVALSSLPRSWQPSVSLLLMHTIRPNLVFDRETYNRRVEEARAAIPPVERTYRAGQVIVREGNPITQADLMVLRQLGLLRERPLWPRLIGVSFFVFLMGILIFFYLYKFRRELLRQEQRIILYGFIFVLTALVAKGVSVLRISTQPELASLTGYLVPVAGGAILITVLLDKGLAVFTSFFFSLLVGVMTDGQLNFIMAGFVGCLAGIYSMYGLSDRSGLIRGGVYVSLANVAVIIIIGLLNDTALTTVFAGAGMGVLNGFLSSVLAVGLLPYLEAAFGITSSVRLLELANPGQPLLKRLLTEAPGTYHHSILVGNLAEAAAEAVQADPLLVRVGAYYHDIGKLKRPYFFIENQIARENPHDKIAPSLSTLIITSHVKDGLELAREYKLPPEIQGIIEQHHGTSLVAYFYQKALESERPELVTEAEFRYDSKKPQSKEAALVMLADGVEAAIRSLQKPTPGRLESLTRKIIKEKLQDGQLDECDLTFKDLNRIAAAFVRVLGGIFHSRIEYPEPALISELERRRSRGAVANQ